MSNASSNYQLYLNEKQQLMERLNQMQKAYTNILVQNKGDNQDNAQVRFSHLSGFSSINDLQKQ
jgi:hypothetical protein